MAGSSRVNRPYARKRRTPQSGPAGKGGPATARLAALAGGLDRASVEALERRQMLFALTITPDDVNPNTGLGSVTTYFGYTVPLLTPTRVIQPPPPNPTRGIENFDQQAPGAVGNGIFLMSGIQVRHNITPASDIVIDPPDVMQNARYLRSALTQAGQFMSFQFFNVMPGQPAVPFSVTDVTFEARGNGLTDGTGLETDRIRVSLIFNQVVIATFTGAALRAQFTAGNPNTGVGTISLAAPANNPAFDTFRIEAIAPPAGLANPQFQLDNITWAEPPTNQAPGVEGRVFGAQVTLAGPVGARVEFRDLYGRDMNETISLLKFPNSRLPQVDLNGDGVPDFNDSIGSIILSGVDSRSSLTLWGGNIVETTTDPANDDFFNGFFSYTNADAVLGNFDDMEQAGFGYAVIIPPGGGIPMVRGLPPGPGSVVIGSPFVRELDNYNPGGIATDDVIAVPNGFYIDPANGSFVASNQGIFIDDGSSMGSISIHGVVHGSSRFSGFVDRLSIGYLVGSVSVAGDIGQLLVGSDAGAWVLDAGQNLIGVGNPIFKTNSQVIVGRTVGEIAVAGRSLLDVTVVGDVNSPITRPARDAYTYYEKEYVLGIDLMTPILATIRANLDPVTPNFDPFVPNRSPLDIFRIGDQAQVFGSGYYRNDNVLSAEFIGGTSASARIRGEVSGRDPINTADDAADVYAFVADGTQDIVIDGAGLGGFAVFRIVDVDGRTIGAPSLPLNQGPAAVPEQQTFRFRPPQAGVYYLVVTDGTGLATEVGVGLVPYVVNVTGMATTTVGAYRTGGSMGMSAAVRPQDTSNSFTVLNGSVGSIRVGTAWTDSGGMEAYPREVYNARAQDNNADNSMSFRTGTFSIAGTLYNITTGSDIGATNLNDAPTEIRFDIGGNLGTVYTGKSPVAGTIGPNEGDMNFIRLNVGGTIGEIRVQGAIGVEQDTNRAVIAAVPITIISSGLNGGRGDIGLIRVGFHVGGDTFSVRTSPGSTIGGLLVSQDAYLDTNPFSGIFLGNIGLPITTGPGSDLRFFDAPTMTTVNNANLFFPLQPNIPVELIDDGGARVRITLTPGTVAGVTGFVIAVPVDGSQGVAIGRISANLAGGATITVDAQDATGGGPGTPGQPTRGGTVGVGRIDISAADAFSAVLLTGVVQLDVYQIVQRGGDAFGSITNNTPNGDIVAIDVATLTDLTIGFGNLGSTQLPSVGPRTIAPLLGVQSGLVADSGGALGILTMGIIDPNFNGMVYRPVNDDNLAAGNAYFDEVGAPLDPYLNGLVVRAGDVTSVVVSGSVGDVILQGGTARLGLVRANSDNLTAPNAFDGIIGNIYAFNVATVDIGDGLARPEQSPFLNVGIVASNFIGTVTSSRTSGAVVSGVIQASNVTLSGNIPGDPVPGIEALTFTNAVIQDASFLAMDTDSFWEGVDYVDGRFAFGAIGSVNIVNSTFFRNRVEGALIGTFTMQGGFYDASSISARFDLTSVNVTAFRNSTLRGDPSEYRPNFIGAGGSIGSIVAMEDAEDLQIDVNTSVTGAIRARNFVRTSIDVDNILTAVTATGSIRASQIQAGDAPSITAMGDIQNSSILISGIVRAVQADRIINTRISSTGPDGKVQSVVARGLISGEISASGAIEAVTSTAGDITALIKTTTINGNVGILSAARDLAITADVAGNINSLLAGRNIGDPARRGVIAIKGDLVRADAPGQLHADLRVGGGISGPVTIGRVVSRPERDFLGAGSVIAFGNIASVAVTGDFDGDIISYSGNVTSVAITDGSLLPGRTIAAYDGDVVSVVITNGNLYGNIHADYVIRSVRVVAGADGVFGDVGVNPSFSQFTPYDAFRNRLPVGVSIADAKQGPRITAGQDIASFVVTNGSVFESTFHAGRALKSVSITGDVRNDFLTSATANIFAAGDMIENVTITGFAGNTAFVAGLVDLGADGLLGGTGANADRLKSGVLDKATVGGGVDNALIIAGITPGGDGLYNTTDDRAVVGTSVVNQLNFSGNVTNVTVLADSLAGSVSGDGRFGTRRTDFLPDNPNSDSGLGTPGTQFNGSRTFNFGGGTVTLNLGGPGTGFFDAGTGRVTLRGTNGSSTFSVTSSLGSLNNFDIVTNDDAALASLSVTPTLTGDSDIFVDGGVGTLTLGQVSGTGDLTIGGDITTATFGTLTGGFFSARHVNALTVNGDFGNANSGIFNEARISLLSSGTLAFRAGSRAAVSVDRGATSVTLSGTTDRSAFRFGWSLGSFTAPGLSRTVLSVGDTLTTVAVTGEMFDSAVIAGIDLGTDSAFGGTGTAADRATTGFIGAVSVTGNVRESDIVAGYYRGADAFYGTGDDTVAPGLGTIGSVVVGGTVSGSTRNSESYLLGASGIIGNFTIGGVPFSGTLGNFHTESSDGVLAPIALTIADIAVEQVSRQYIATLAFNQGVDGSTLSRGLQVSEMRGDQSTLIRLVEGVDYTIGYDPAANAARVAFAVALTQRNLPQIPGLPGPGVFRFELLQNIIRGKSLGNQTDGNADGYSALSDHISQDVVVGDAGDKFFAETLVAGPAGRQVRVDFYGPSNLDWVLDNNASPDGLPDINRVYTVRGTIGDHPDNDVNQFRFASDTDVYSITLQAGQVLRLGPLEGPAANGGLFLIDLDGNFVDLTGQNTPAPPGQNPLVSAVSLPVAIPEDGVFYNTQQFLIKRTGVYRIVTGTAFTFNTPGVVPNLNPVAAGVGEYRFTVEVFDDGDSGFSGAEDAGNGTLVIPAPPPINFAGADGTLGTPDDLTEISLGTYTFTLDRATSIVTGVSSEGVTSTTFPDGRQVSMISAAIGNPGHYGVPNTLSADVDVFHLNNRSPIAPGTKMRVTVKLIEHGADLGSISPIGLDLPNSFLPIGRDFRGAVQFGIFDTSASVGPDDANLVFAPSDFSPNGGTPNTVIADNGKTKYGFDANGDFYVEFLVPERMGAPGVAGTFAVYLQGVVNNDYQVEVVTNGTDTLPAPTRQNFFIETGGGSVNWAQVGGVTSNLGAFSARTLGFNGLVGGSGLDAQTYILSNLITTLNALFQSSANVGGGYDVHFSTNPADFEFEPFSTIFLTSSNDPVSNVFFDLLFFTNPTGFSSGSTLTGVNANNEFVQTNQPFGLSEHSDPFNTDVEDEAVVFAPSFGDLGLTPGQAGVDRFVQSLTAAIGRCAGELMGLRLTADYNTAVNTFTTHDPFAANSVWQTPGSSRAYAFSQTPRYLSGQSDTVVNTEFFLGRQDSRSLLDKILGRI